MVIKPDEAVDGSAARGERKERPDVQTLVIDRAEKAFHLAVRLRGVGTQQVMANTKGGAGLLKTREPLVVERMAHREGKRVVGEHRFDRIRKSRHDLFEKRRGRETRGIRADRDDGFAAKVIDGGKFEVISGISERRQIFEIDMDELARSLFFVPARRRAWRPRQLALTMPLQHPLHGAMADVQSQ